MLCYPHEAFAALGSVSWLQIRQLVHLSLCVVAPPGLSKILGKPTQYITVTLTRGSVRHSGSCDPAASVSVHSIGGISSRTNNMICAEVAALCQQHLKVPVDRV